MLPHHVADSLLTVKPPLPVQKIIRARIDETQREINREALAKRLNGYVGDADWAQSLRCAIRP